MDKVLQEEFMRSIFRFRKIGMPFHKNFNLHMGEFAVMQGIAGEDALGGNEWVPDIHEKLHISRPAVSQMLGGLEKKGYILRETDQNDRRKIVITITSEGREVMKDMKKNMENMFNEIANRFGEENMKQLIVLLNHFADVSHEVRNSVR
jgi:DNA-binding MarR family transcriptional regulator